MSFIEAQTNEQVLRDVALGLAYADALDPFITFAVIVAGTMIVARWLARNF